MSADPMGAYLAAFDQGFRDGDKRVDEKLAEAANVKLMQDVVRAIAARDFVALGALMTDDVVLDIRSAAALPFIAQARGRSAVLDAVRHNFAGLREQRPTIDAVTAQGDTIVVVSREEGQVAATGQRYRVSGVQRFVIRDGKVALVEEHVVPLETQSR